jgi:hypothetical protein
VRDSLNTLRKATKTSVRSSNIQFFSLQYIYLPKCVPDSTKCLPLHLHYICLLMSANYRTLFTSAKQQRSETLPTTSTGHYTICCKKTQSCAPEDGQRFVRNMLSRSWKSIKLLLLHLVGVPNLLYVVFMCLTVVMRLKCVLVWLHVDLLFNS